MSTVKSNSSFRLFIDSIPWRFFRKIALGQILISCIIILLVAFVTQSHMKNYFINQSYDQIDDSLSIIKENIETNKIEPITWCKSLRLNWKARYTLLNDEGHVLCDNYMSPEYMDNHSDRPEIIEALSKGRGFSVRYSKLLKKDLIYGAFLIGERNSPGNRYIIRQAVPLNKLQKALGSFRRKIWFFLLPLFIFTSLLSLWSSLQVSFPLRSLLQKVDLMKSMTSSEENTYILDPSDEWTIVEKTLDKAKGNLEKYLNELYVENEKFSALLESISDSIIALDRDQKILFLNNQFKKQFLDKNIRKEELKNLHLNEIFRNYDLQHLIEQLFDTQSPIKKRNVEIPIKGGNRTSFFTIKMSPMFGKDNNLFGLVIVFADVTEQRMAEQMREDFVANVSHEVRTPLTSLKGYTQMAKSMAENEKIKDFLDKIEFNSDRLTSLFQDILNLSVIESTARVNKEAVLVEDITENVISNLKQVYPNLSQNIICTYDISTIWANPQMMEQVINNLLENAIKYSGNGTEIQIIWRKGRKGHNDVLEVIDNGPGIDAQHLPRLFERFYRIDSSRSREQGGTGLGLAIVKHIVQVHDGKIEVSSTLGIGTKFQVKIPTYNPNI
ncbi:MAG: HAMP domain-containing sensor histidine kinase [Bdellovibrio sp.]